MAIPEGYKKNFATLIEASDNKALCLMECTDKITGKIIIAVCAAWVDENSMYNFTPIAKMFDGNPYEELNPPMN